MMRRLGTLGFLFASLAIPAAAQKITISDTAKLGVYYHHIADTGDIEIETHLIGAKGSTYILAATLGDPTGNPAWELTGFYPLAEDGTGHTYTRLPLDLFPHDQAVYVRALFLDGKKIRGTDTRWLKVCDCHFGSVEVDFDWASGAIATQAGEVLGEQWAAMGMHILANDDGGGPDQAIIFDSANPTGGDTDLATPNPGLHPSNTEALGKLVIIPENDVDTTPADGLVDDPNDDGAGGTIFFAFEKDVAMTSITLVDIEEGGGVMQFWRLPGVQLLAEIPIPGLGDGSVQTFNFFIEGVTRLDVTLEGSGAVGGLSLQPCPMIIQWDESPAGVPLNLPAGTWFTTQLRAETGLSLWADNAKAGHPDKAILFDSANPTGGDDDLRTPGAGLGNDTAEGMLLIIAENDLDRDPEDGLVDDPDDEAYGGDIFMHFCCEVRFKEARVIDIDATEDSYFELLDEFNGVLGTVPLAQLGDNSAQTVLSDQDGVQTIRLHFGGSGGLAYVKVCPDCDCPHDTPEN